MILHDLETRLLASAELRKEFYFDWQISGREEGNFVGGSADLQNRSLSEQKSAESTFLTPRAPGGPLFSACRKRNVKRATLSFIAVTPGHGLKRLKEVDELSLMKRAICPGIERPNKAPAIRDKAVHGIADTWVRVFAGINAILLSKTSDVPNL